MENSSNNFSSFKNIFTKNVNNNNFTNFSSNENQYNNNKISEEYLINLESLIKGISLIVIVYSSHLNFL